MKSGRVPYIAPDDIGQSLPSYGFYLSAAYSYVQLEFGESGGTSTIAHC